MTGSRQAPLTLPRAVLAVGGSVSLLGGMAAVVAGWRAQAWIYSLLPPVEIDADAVGGATVALGLALIGLGTLQLAVSARIGRGRCWESTAASALAGLVAAALVSLAATAFTEAASSAANAWLVAVGFVLLGVSIAYAVSAWRLAHQLL